ncbi:MAG TPA: methyl-coenzyme M reductase operon protein D [Candidatus Methanomethylophilaceae archaeon]|nr:methyl-coenzyme M reductase operon protein D [Candidatus Methanomethylophilaceae archaeon]
MSKPPAEYAGIPLPEVRVTTNRFLNAETTEKVLNGLEGVENIRQINITGKSLPSKINSGPNKGLDNKHSERRTIKVGDKEVELTYLVGSFYIELGVDNEEMLEKAAGEIEAICAAHIEHGYSLQIGRYSKYRPSLRDYRGV